MRPVFCVLGILWLTACSPPAPLTLADKARFVFELIEREAGCNTFRQRLTTAETLPDIDAIYHDAMQHTCIRRDV